MANDLTAKRTLKKKHGMFRTFSGMMRDAIFMVGKEDMDREHRKLSNSLFENQSSCCYENRKKKQQNDCVVLAPRFLMTCQE